MPGGEDSPLVWVVQLLLPPFIFCTNFVQVSLQQVSSNLRMRCNFPGIKRPKLQNTDHSSKGSVAKATWNTHKIFHGLSATRSNLLEDFQSKVRPSVNHMDTNVTIQMMLCMRREEKERKVRERGAIGRKEKGKRDRQNNIGCKYHKSTVYIYRILSQCSLHACVHIKYHSLKSTWSQKEVMNILLLNCALKKI